MEQILSYQKLFFNIVTANSYALSQVMNKSCLLLYPKSIRDNLDEFPAQNMANFKAKAIADMLSGAINENTLWCLHFECQDESSSISSTSSEKNAID